MAKRTGIERSGGVCGGWREGGWCEGGRLGAGVGGRVGRRRGRGVAREEGGDTEEEPGGFARVGALAGTEAGALAVGGGDVHFLVVEGVEETGEGADGVGECGEGKAADAEGGGGVEAGDAGLDGGHRDPGGKSVDGSAVNLRDALEGEDFGGEVGDDGIGVWRVEGDHERTLAIGRGSGRGRGGKRAKVARASGMSGMEKRVTCHRSPSSDLDA